MIKILIIEDNDRKAGLIIKSLLENPFVSKDFITVYPDIVNAKKDLSKNTYDLLVLDIQIPLRFGDVPMQDGGLQLLKELTTNPKYCLPVHIMGITAVEGIYDEADKIFRKELWQLVYYDESTNEWSSQLRKKLDYLVKVKQDLLANTIDDNKCDYVILCALEHVELDAIKKYSISTKLIEITNDLSYYHYCTISKDSKVIQVIAASALQMGMAASAILATKVIQMFRPKYLFMTGILAGVSPELNYGDIIIADPTYDYGSGKYIFESDKTIFKPAHFQQRLDTMLLNKVKKYISESKITEKIQSEWTGKPNDTPLKAVIGPVASGAAVIASEEIVKTLIDDQRKLLGIEMEAYSVYLAGQNCFLPRPITMSVKSVSDFANRNKGDSFQEYAAYTSTAFLFNFILDCLDS